MCATHAPIIEFATYATATVFHSPIHGRIDNVLNCAIAISNVSVAFPPVNSKLDWNDILEAIFEAK